MHMPVMGATKFERFFRSVADLDVDRNDLKRYNEFVGRKLYDLIVVAEAKATANGRDLVQPFDLPVTRGLQQCILEFERRVDPEIELKPILEHLATLPPLDLALADETEARIPGVAGGLSVALARAFTIMDGAMRNPSSEDWERALRIFDLLL
jgi:hypothetical protein